MKERLNQLTLAQFIEMECGNVEVLKDSHREVVSPEKLAKVRLNIAREFQQIASPASYKSMLIDHEKKSKLRAKAILYGAMKALVDIDAIDDVRKLLDSAGVDCTGFDDKRIRSEVEQRHNTATFELKRMGVDAPSAEEVTPDEIRRGYEGMVADLMIANKMSIDIETIRASVFASMIQRANEMAKSLKSKINSKSIK